ncbi:hypothetical protein CDAR_317971 [Caerostris darwini]|uniref:Uncharacterized protein n=1 Tax=Caerostris darwini TaxID=1538125 RepID=A0AAV4WST0_9ARAC|nr:hypothetical protein CDAR_317971 [Caerostris darwini]
MIGFPEKPVRRDFARQKVCWSVNAASDSMREESAKHIETECKDAHYPKSRTMQCTLVTDKFLLIKTRGVCAEHPSRHLTSHCPIILKMR